MRRITLTLAALAMLVFGVNQTAMARGHYGHGGFQGYGGHHAYYPYARNWGAGYGGYGLGNYYGGYGAGYYGPGYGAYGYGPAVGAAPYYGYGGYPAPGIGIGGRNFSLFLQP